MMTSGTWIRFRSVRELALRYDMQLENAEKYAAEAARIIRLSHLDEEGKALILERIRQLGILAEFRTEEALTIDGDIVQLRKPDLRTSMDSAKTLASIVGLIGPNTDIVIRLQQMPDAELWAEAERYGRELTEGKKIHETTGQTIETAISYGPPANADDDTGRDSESEASALDRLITKPNG